MPLDCATLTRTSCARLNTTTLPVRRSSTPSITLAPHSSPSSHPPSCPTAKASGTVHGSAIHAHAVGHRSTMRAYTVAPLMGPLLLLSRSLALALALCNRRHRRRVGGHCTAPRVPMCARHESAHETARVGAKDRDKAFSLSHTDSKMRAICVCARARAFKRLTAGVRAGAGRVQRQACGLCSVSWGVCQFLPWCMCPRRTKHLMRQGCPQAMRKTANGCSAHPHSFHAHTRTFARMFARARMGARARAH